MLPRYAKPYLPIPDQVQLLRSRGLIIDDVLSASEWLERIGYYRFSGYAYPFRKSKVVIDPQTRAYKVVVLDDFQPGIYFSQVTDIYQFDQGLRLLFLEAIETVEVGLQVELVQCLGRLDKFAHLDASHFHPKFSLLSASGSSRHADWVAKQNKKFNEARDEFVRHFKAHYLGDPPIWIACELWDFGMMSTLLSGLKTPDLNRISGRFLLLRPDILPSWTRNLNVVRNICAHHGRLWNRSLASVRPVLPRPGELSELDHLVANRDAQARAYGSAVLLRHLLKYVQPQSDWKNRLRTHVAGFPRAGIASAAQGGFPKDWASLVLWK